MRRKRQRACATVMLSAICFVLAPTAGARAAPPAMGGACEGTGAGALGSLLGEAPSPSQIEGPLAPPVLARFSVLRRAPGALDAVPPLNPLAEELSYQLAGYYPSYVRELLTLGDGRRFILVVGLPRVAAVPPARCLPRSQRTQRAKLVEEQLRRAREPVFCVATLAGNSAGPGGEASCSSFAELETGANLLAGAGVVAASAQLVPDGVAAVRLAYRSGASLTLAVSANAYTFRPPAAPIERARAALSRLLAGVHSAAQLNRLLHGRSRAIARVRNLFEQLPPAREEWLAGDGGVLRTIVPPLARFQDVLGAAA